MRGTLMMMLVYWWWWWRWWRWWLLEGQQPSWRPRCLGYSDSQRLQQAPAMRHWYFMIMMIMMMIMTIMIKIMVMITTIMLMVILSLLLNMLSMPSCCSWWKFAVGVNADGNAESALLMLKWMTMLWYPPPCHKVLHSFKQANSFELECTWSICIFQSIIIVKRWVCWRKSGGRRRWAEAALLLFSPQPTPPHIGPNLILARRAHLGSGERMEQYLFLC